MQLPPLDTTTTAELKKLKVLEQYGKFLRVLRIDAIQHFKNGRRLLVMVRSGGYWATQESDFSLGNIYLEIY